MPDFNHQRVSAENECMVVPEGPLVEARSFQERRALTVDRARMEDMPVIRQVIGDAWVELYESHFSLEGVADDIQKYLNDDSLQGMLENPLGLMLVARDSLTAGPCGVLYGYGAEHKGTAELLYLYLSPSARGSGAGSSLLGAFEQHFADHHQFQLEVFAANTGAQGFYQRAGFVRTGECQGTIGDRIGTWHTMVKNVQVTIQDGMESV